MYIIVKDNQIIAAHEDREIIQEYLLSQSDQMKVLKIKKKKTKELIDIPDFEEIYLVRYGNFYVPYGQYAMLKELNGQRDFDLKYCRDILFRLLEENTVTNKETSIIKKTLQIVESQIENLDDSEYNMLENMRKQMDEITGGN